MSRFHLIDVRKTAVAAALAFMMVPGTVRPGGAAAEAPAASAIEFDEIDHVYATDNVPPPGSFQQDAGQVALSAPPEQAPKKHRGVFEQLSSASNVLGGASSVVASSGELGRAIGITDTVDKLAPLTTALGMAGSRRLDALLQTFVLPRVTPTGAVMLAGFLNAKADFNSRFPSAPAQSPQDPPPTQLVPYSKGTLQHYTIAPNGWVRIENADTKLVLIIKPDAGKSFIIDAAAKTVRVADYVRSTPATVSSSAAGSGRAGVDAHIETLGQSTLDGVAVSGFRTRSMLRVAGGGAKCPDTTITSTRVEYFATYRVASDAANTSPAGQTSDVGGCEPVSTVKHDGSNIPKNRLLVYQANTIDKKTASGNDHYTVVIERGNLHESSASDTSAFDIPAAFHQVSAVTRGGGNVLS